MAFFESIKNIVFILIFIQLFPIAFGTIKQSYHNYIDPKARVGVIKMHGTLDDSAAISNQLNTFFKDPTIKALLMRIDCGGAAAGTAESLFTDIELLKKEYAKPVIALVENVCASGGYWIACAADHIITPSTALIGSIGVHLPYLFKLNTFITEHNIGYIAAQAGTYKTVTNPFTPPTPEGQAHLQNVLDDSYAQFTHAVATARKRALSQTDEWADGKLFTGKQALAIGLVDEIGSMQTALRVVKEKALIEGDIEWVHTQQSFSWWHTLFNTTHDESRPLLAGLCDGICTYLESKYNGSVLH